MEPGLLGVPFIFRSYPRGFEYIQSNFSKFSITSGGGRFIFFLFLPQKSLQHRLRYGHADHLTGATITAFFAFVDDYYAEAHGSTLQPGTSGPGPSVAANEHQSDADPTERLRQYDSDRHIARETEVRPAVDRFFRAKIWRWVTDHPDVTVDKGNSGNELTDELVVDLYEKAAQATRSNVSAAAGHSSDLANSNISSVKPATPELPAEINGIKIRVPVERVWYALTGHGVDHNRCPRKEFACLVTIAQARERGILQTDLTKLSAQDKRSVPRRTDFLHARGYIEKRTAMGTVRGTKRGIRTSLLVHRRFAARLAAIEKTTSAAVAQSDGADPCPLIAHVLDLEEFTKGFLELIKGGELVAKSDLRHIMVR
jgi:DNA-binding MarR family transcriptional regulator